MRLGTPTFRHPRSPGAATVVASIIVAALVGAACGGDPEPADTAARREATSAEPTATQPSESTSSVATTAVPGSSEPATDDAARTVAGDETDASTTERGAAGEPDASCLNHDGRERCWLTVAPDGTGAGAPLLIDLHGWTGSADGQRRASGFEALAHREGFVAVWAVGEGKSWNAGPGCCPPANRNKVDDVGFFRLLVDEMADVYDIDRARVYVTGLSNGCAMAQRLANDASDLVAAVACMSLFLLVEPDPQASAVPVMEIHGTNDSLVTFGPGLFQGAQANFETWAEHNGCAGEPVETWREGASTVLSHLDCVDDVEVALATIDGGGHNLYRGIETDVDTARLAWNFLERFERPAS